MRRLATRLGLDVASQEAFLACLTRPNPLPGGLVWTQDKPSELPWPEESEQSWQPPFVSRVKDVFQPGKHPWHDEGKYYCLDMSSVFAGTVVAPTVGSVHCALDVCASPGGKAILTHRWHADTDFCLVANEIVPSRRGILRSNLRRCLADSYQGDVRDTLRPGVYAAGFDVDTLAGRYREDFDLVVVDAPCSGQSLLARGQDAPGAFSPQVIDANVRRQRKILATAAECVKPGGWLAYMTCTYSPEENEGIVEWLTERFTTFHAVPVRQLKGHASCLTDLPAYRLWPMSRIGAGAFTCLLKRSAKKHKTG